LYEMGDVAKEEVFSVHLLCVVYCCLRTFMVTYSLYYGEIHTGVKTVWLFFDGELLAGSVFFVASFCPRFKCPRQEDRIYFFGRTLAGHVCGSVASTLAHFYNFCRLDDVSCSTASVILWLLYVVVVYFRRLVDFHRFDARRRWLRVVSCQVSCNECCARLFAEDREGERERRSYS